MEVAIRAYNAADRADCLEAFKSNVPVYFTPQEVSEFESFLDRIQNTAPGEHRTSQTHYYVVVYQDKIVGCGGFGDKDGKNIISLAWGLIHQDFHKKGLGAALLVYRIEQLRKLYPSQPLVVDTTQHCYGFFEKFGFAITNITPDYYAPGMHRYDMCFGSKEAAQVATSVS